MSIAAGKEFVCVWHVYDRTAFSAVLVADVESDVIFDVEFLEAFGLAEEVPECKTVLMMSVDVK